MMQRETVWCLSPLFKNQTHCTLLSSSYMSNDFLVTAAMLHVTPTELNDCSQKPHMNCRYMSSETLSENVSKHNDPLH